jgi:hypothetical protein
MESKLPTWQIFKYSSCLSLVLPVSPLMICGLFTLLLHSHLKISKIQELLQVVVSSCMECLRAWAGIEIMMISILRRLQWLSQMSVGITQASSQWTTRSESCYSYQFDDRDNVVSSFHALKCSKMDFQWSYLCFVRDSAILLPGMLSRLFAYISHVHSPPLKVNIIGIC